MRKIKSFLCIALTLLLASSCLALSASAEGEGITLRMINCNVAGLPSISGIIGIDGADVGANQRVIGQYIADGGFDIVAVQEDFGYHRQLEGALDGYISTNHTGSIPGGDGLNLFTKNMTIYNETRVRWNDSYGVIPEGDRLTPKGILYAVIEVSPGVYIDFYDIHADAFDTEGSREARESNYKQLADMICENYEKYNRPVIVTGDFNACSHARDVNSNMYTYFQEQCGLKDAWTEVHNGGDYHDFSKWHASGVGAWGNWDSVEKFMYKGGGGFNIEAVDFKYTYIKDENGTVVSDHAAAECTVSLTADPYAAAPILDEDLEVVKPSIFSWFRQVKWIFIALYEILSNPQELATLFE